MDNQAAQANEINVLIERGMTFVVPRRSAFRWLGKPERSFLIQQPYLGTMDRLSAELVHLDFSEETLSQNALPEARRLAGHNARRCARVVAIAVLNSRWKIQWLTWLLTRYLLWRVTPQKLLELTMLINSMSNLGDFITAIRYLNPAPARIAAKPGDSAHSDSGEPSAPISDGLTTI